MRATRNGRLSDLLLVRLHGRAPGFLSLGPTARAAIVEACKREATAPDLAQRILARTIYSQAASRLSALRELVQNALDATPPGGEIRISLSPCGRLLAVEDGGPGMTRDELVEDLLVPFRTTKEGSDGTIGEHGVGFLSALDFAPFIDIETVGRDGPLRLSLSPYAGPLPAEDFAYRLEMLDETEAGALGLQRGTRVRLKLAEAQSRATLASELTLAAGLVDPARARITFDGFLVNTARAAYRVVARVDVACGAQSLGVLTLSVGRGDSVAPQLVIAQAGLVVCLRSEPFAGPALVLHRDLARALANAGYGLLVDLPERVPLHKGRSAVAASAAVAVERAIAHAFERYIVEDALQSRELLRTVDHRLSGVLDRLLRAAILGEAPMSLAPVPTGAPVGMLEGTPPETGLPSSAEDAAEYAPRSRPVLTVAAPEEVTRFAAALLDAPLLKVFRARATDAEPVVVERVSLRAVLEACRRGVLRAGSPEGPPGALHLVVDDSLSEALWQRLFSAQPAPAAEATAQPEPAPAPRMPPTGRRDVLAAARRLPGSDALAAFMLVLEHVDKAIADAAGLSPSPISVHQNLYGADEMAHTDGNGISVNVASPRVRELARRTLSQADPIAFGALVDLVLHEKTHVALAGVTPRPNAEHGTSFYRKKDQLRRVLLEGLACRRVNDPAAWLPVLQRTLATRGLPSPEQLAEIFAPQQQAA